MPTIRDLLALPCREELRDREAERAVMQLVDECEPGLANRLEFRREEDVYRAAMERLAVEVVLQGTNQYDDDRRSRIVRLLLDGRPFGIMSVRDSSGEDDEHRIRLSVTDPSLCCEALDSLRLATWDPSLNASLDENASSLLSNCGYCRAQPEEGNIRFLAKMSLVNVFCQKGRFTSKVELMWFEGAGYCVFLDSKHLPRLGPDEALASFKKHVGLLCAENGEGDRRLILFRERDSSHAVLEPENAAEEAYEAAEQEVAAVEAAKVAAPPQPS